MMQAAKTRWEDCHESYPLRIKYMAEHIHPGESVLDVGAGTLALRGFLPVDCRYTPLDLWPRAPDTIVVDLNDPEGLTNALLGKSFDVVFISGTLEYLNNPCDAIRRLALVCRRLLTASYLHGGREDERNRWGFANRRSVEEIRSTLMSCGLRLIMAHFFDRRTEEVVYVAEALRQ